MVVGSDLARFGGGPMLGLDERSPRRRFPVMAGTGGWAGEWIARGKPPFEEYISPSPRHPPTLCFILAGYFWRGAA